MTADLRGATQASATTGTVYRHFATKEALYQAIVVGHVDRLNVPAPSGPTSGRPRCWPCCGARGMAAETGDYPAAVLDRGLAVLLDGLKPR